MGSCGEEARETQQANKDRMDQPTLKEFREANSDMVLLYCGCGGKLSSIKHCSIVTLTVYLSYLLLLFVGVVVRWCLLPV